MARHGIASTRKEAVTCKEAARNQATRDSHRPHIPKVAGEDACDPSMEAAFKFEGVNVSRKSRSIDASLKRRTRLLITNGSIPKQTRSLIRYALEIRDPYLAQVVRRVEEGETTIEGLHVE